MKIRYNLPFISGNELENIQDAFEIGHLSGDGKYTKLCSKWFEEEFGCEKSLMTHSCTAALEMSAILAELGPGDEVIMPSFTFVSTANAVVLRGATPVFVDIRPDTLNLDERLIEAAITEKTKAIMVVHYAGVGCEMDEICAIAKKHDLIVIEDAAQGILSKYKGRWLGTIGELAAFSFHETKNIISGEGGALFINDQKHIERAEIIREKGTDRSKFFRGMVDKYTWVDVGSSYLPSEIISAFLYAQLGNIESIISNRLKIWNHYKACLAPLAEQHNFTLPHVPSHCEHNGHIFYMLLESQAKRSAMIAALKEDDISSVFHYIPLHSAPKGIEVGRCGSDMTVTDDISERLLRLPLWSNMTTDIADKVIASIKKHFGEE